MEQEIPLNQLTKKGAMTKSPFEMTKSEYFVWQLQNQIDARNNLFAIGQPFVHEKDGEIVAEHSDGRVQHIR
jgi:hypothetical protein